MDVASWLRSLGLEQYEAAFRENAIDVSVLPDLTDQDLEKLGVLLGHCRKLLRAIANLETTAKAAQGAVGVPADVVASPRDTAERRQVTASVKSVAADAAEIAKRSSMTQIGAEGPLSGSAAPLAVLRWQNVGGRPDPHQNSKPYCVQLSTHGCPSTQS